LYSSFTLETYQISLLLAKMSSRDIEKPQNLFSTNSTAICHKEEYPGSSTQLHPDLPICFMDSEDRIILSSDAPEQFLELEFDVSKLNHIHKHLWWAGRPVPARPLHKQLMLERTIVVTQQASLHLLWKDQRIYIKPLPACLLDQGAWTSYLARSKNIHSMAKGFILSYVWLVRSQTDFAIAQDRRLLPAGLTWNDWSCTAKSIATQCNFNSKDTINQRYTYGELRIKRLNQICRLTALFPCRPQILVQGYASDHSSYGSFFQQNFAWIFVPFAYVSILLSALQVGVGVEELRVERRFRDVAYVLTVATMIVPVVIAVIALFLFVGLFCYHLGRTTRFQRSLKKRWKEEDGPRSP
jgi:hypothetical protein